MWFRNLKARTLWILTGVIFVITIGAIVLCTQVPKDYTTACIIVMAIGFVLTTVLVQMASFKTFKFKVKKDPVHPVDYTTDSDLYDILRKNKFKERNRGYGLSFLRIDRPNAFKVTLITDSEKYFNPEKEEATAGDKELDKCERMCAFEIFLDYKPEDIEKMGDYSIQAKNIYYTAFYKKDEHTYTCANYLEPEESHKENYEYLMNLFKFNKIEESSENKK